MSSFLGEIGDILTGGLQSALDLEIAERLGALDPPGTMQTAPPPRGETDRGLRTNDGRTIRVGEPGYFISQVEQVPPLVWAGLAVGLVLVFVVLRR